MSGLKRCAVDQDPDYEEIRPHNEKRQRLFEEGAKEATVRKIENILHQQFSQEIQNKEGEILLIDERLNQARLMADRLRACIVASFYGKAGLNVGQLKTSGSQSAIHPAVKRFLGKAPKGAVSTLDAASVSVKSDAASTSAAGHSHDHPSTPEQQIAKKPKLEPKSSSASVILATQKKTDDSAHLSRFKVKRRIIVGNVSKYIPVEKREDNDRSTHRWMVYVRGPVNNPNIDSFVDKVWFFLHPSYKPHDLVEIKEKPFHLTRRGWGEFPVRIQLHFKDTRNKRVDIIHNLKVVDIELERDSVGLPKPNIPTASLNTAGPPQRVSATKPTQSKNGKPFTAKSSTEVKITAEVKQEVDLSIVKTEPMDTNSDAEVSSIVVNSKWSEEGTISPPRPGTVTPVKMVFGPLGTSPARVKSPALSTTPVKGGSGWTRIQIKSEPTSPQALTSPSTKKGWQNIANLTSPIKTEPNSGRTTPINITPMIATGSSTPEPRPSSATSPAKLILSPGGGGIAQLANTNKKDGGEANKAAVVGHNSAGGAFVPTVVTGVRTPAASPAPRIVTSTPTSTTGKQQQQQPTVYIRCRDNMGKVYLIPQHVLNKTSTSSSTSTGPQTTFVTSAPPKPSSSQQVQRVSTPLGMAIISPGSSTALPIHQTSNQGKNNVAMGTVQALASLASRQQSIATSTTAAISISPKAPSITTTIKNAGKTATLTYVLATSGGTSGTPTLTPGSQGQKVVALPAATSQGQSLILTSAVGQGEGQSLGLQKVGAKSPLTVLASKPGLQVSPATTVSSGSAVGDTKRSLLLSPPLGENVRIVGGNIIAGPGGAQKGSNIVLINQSPVIAQSTTLTAASGGKTSGISLLTGMTGIRARGATKSSQTTSATIAPARVPNPMSLLNKINPASVRQVSPGTVIIRPENPKVGGGQSRHLATASGSIVSPQRAVTPPQLLLIPATPAAGPAVVMTTDGKKAGVLPGQPGALPQQPILGTIGNQKVIVQLMPQQATSVQPPSEVKQTEQPAKQMAAPVSSKNSLNQPSDSPASAVGVGTVGPGSDEKLSEMSSSLSPPKKDLPATKVTPIDEKKIELSRYHSLEELVRAMVRCHPIVQKTVDRSVHPYCAETEAEFLDWRLGKRRAAEWCRAAAVQRRIRAALTTGENQDRGSGDDDMTPGCHGDHDLRYHGELLWSKKRIVWWCRHHSYTPWDQGLCELLERRSAAQNAREEGQEENPLTSRTEATALVERVTDTFREREKLEAGPEDEEDIDIISCELVHPPVRIKKEIITSPQSSSDPPVYVEPSDSVHYVREVAAQIGVQMRAVEVDQNEAPGVHVHVVEDMIMAVTKTLMGDVVRKAKALLLETFRSCEMVGADHIFHALQTIPLCDILTNSGLGVLSTSNKDKPDKITLTTHPPA